MGDKEEHHEAQVQPPKATGTKKVRKGSQNNPEASSWIVPDRILPRSLLPEETPEKRHGLGKWVISRPAVIQAMIREGKFKVIHPTAYIRPDILQVMYAQFTMAAVSSIQERLAQYRQMFLLPNLAGRKSTENTNASHGRSEAMQKIPLVCLDQVRQANFKTDDTGSSAALEKREADVSLHLTPINEASSKLRDQIHCVLRFDNVSVEDLLAALEKQPYGSLPLHKLSLADIALPPSTLTSNLVLENVTISTSNSLDGEHRRSSISVPCFNMHELFGHHCRRGYEIILHACTDTLALQQLLLEKRVSSRSKRAEMLAEARRQVARLICDVNIEKRSDDRETLWIIVRQHEHTTPWILLLWKMYLGLPKITTQS
ncbi:hypothetical protein BGW42_005504 [Actinomortierella wolfii]|nr:hypothetical protein BGW42_005504 [Actinomortierella wolfii]